VDKVSTSMTINAPASVLLLLYQLVGEEQGVDPAQLTGTIQNDILKEYIARGTYIYPPEPSMRLITDTFAYCAETLPKFNTISISGYHMGEKGATAVQEIAFTLADVLGGTQSLHANSFDEALALPTERAAKIALRTQQIIAAEAGVVETADPLGGSWFIETLTKEIEQRAREYIEKVDKMGGAVKAIEYMQGEIEQAAYEEQQAIEAKKRLVVGVNTQVETDEQPAEILRLDPATQAEQIERVRAVRAARDQATVKQALEDLRDAAKGTD